MTSARKTKAKKAPAAPKRKPRRRVEPDLREPFLAAFFATCSITEAAAELGIDRSQHYRWMDKPAYRLKFEALMPEAAGMLEDKAVRFATRGFFEPAVYKGRYCYEPRERIRCTLADGSEAFKDKLPKKHAKIVSERVVMTPDGPQMGVWRPDTKLLAILLAAWLPGKYRRTIADDDEDSEPPAHNVYTQQR